MTDNNIFENDMHMPEKGIENTTEAETKCERMFTQSKVEELINERLYRERKQNEALMSVKNLLKDFSGKGLIKGNSYFEMASDLAKKLEAGADVLCLETAGKDAVNTSDEDGEGNVSLNDGEGNVSLNDGKEDECAKEDANRENGENFVSVLSKIKAKYPRAAVEKLLSGDLFESFSKGRSGDVLEIFDDFYSFTNKAQGYSDDLEQQAPVFTSTAFSVHSGAVCDGSDLTKQQMEMAKSAGLSYREYAHLLESVPKARTKSF